MTQPDPKAKQPVRAPKPHPNASIVPEGKRRCVICGEFMVQQVQEGLTLDVCDLHGIWLDKDELPRIIERIRMHGHDVRRRAMARTYEEGLRGGVNEGAWWRFVV
jgi:Zn-finger nucleic acid-binding protein